VTSGSEDGVQITHASEKFPSQANFEQKLAECRGQVKEKAKRACAGGGAELELVITGAVCMMSKCCACRLTVRKKAGVDMLQEYEQRPSALRMTANRWGALDG
jgi:hypothetical protein